MVFGLKSFFGARAARRQAAKNDQEANATPIVGFTDDDADNGSPPSQFPPEKSPAPTPSALDALKSLYGQDLESKNFSPISRAKNVSRASRTSKMGDDIQLRRSSSSYGWGENFIQAKTSDTTADTWTSDPTTEISVHKTASRNRADIPSSPRKDIPMCRQKSEPADFGRDRATATTSPRKNGFRRQSTETTVMPSPHKILAEKRKYMASAKLECILAAHRKRVASQKSSKSARTNGTIQRKRAHRLEPRHGSHGDHLESPSKHGEEKKKARKSKTHHRKSMASEPPSSVRERKSHAF
eukprot:GEMP01026169.1.p1 GENE.GEMP01026169.1~~GEMP01026169.1.p1  ORF type:complete len:298 (+),score=71.82 GEMP01026169.1:431-1324(+)